MNTIEDFENAPVGATATGKATGIRAMRVARVGERWVLPSGLYVDDESMARWGYTLDPLEPWPTSAREALDLAWELAHPVKEGQIIPTGTRYLEATSFGLRERTAVIDHTISPGLAHLRTLEPLPEPEPDWLDAPAVLANEPGTGKRGVFIPTDRDTGKHWAVVFSALSYPWQELTDVTPLYPKEVQEA